MDSLIDCSEPRPDPSARSSKTLHVFRRVIGSASSASRVRVGFRAARFRRDRFVGNPPLGFQIVFVALCTLIATAVRFATLSLGGISRDEAQMIWIVRAESLREMIRFLVEHESHPPFYYALLRIWFQLFGDSERSAVSLSLLIGVVLVPVVYYIGARMFSYRTAAIACFLTAFAPALVEFSTRVRPYALFPLLCVSSHYLLWLGLRDRRARVWSAYVVVTTAFIYTHNWSWMAIAGQWIAVGCVFAYSTDSKRERIASIISFLAAQTAIAVAYLPWAPSFLRQASHAGYGPSRPNLGQAISSFFEVAVLDAGVSVPYLVAVLLGLAIAVRGESKDRRDAAALLIAGAGSAAAIAVAAILSIKSYLLIPHCILAVGPSIFLVVCRSIEVAARSRYAKFAVFVAAIVGLQFLRLDLAAARRPFKSNEAEAAKAIADRVEPNDRILVQPQWNASSFFYYYPIDAQRIDYPVVDFRGPIYYDDTARRLADEKAFEDLLTRIDDAARSRARIWFVVDSIAERRIMKIAEYPAKLDPKMDFVDLATIRVDQIRRRLTERYGPPRSIHRTNRVPLHPQTDEIQQVWLFDLDFDRSAAVDVNSPSIESPPDREPALTIAGRNRVESDHQVIKQQ